MLFHFNKSDEVTYSDREKLHDVEARILARRVYRELKIWCPDIQYYRLSENVS
jgi:hypothetical protein